MEIHGLCMDIHVDFRPGMPLTFQRQQANAQKKVISSLFRLI